MKHSSGDNASGTSDLEYFEIFSDGIDDFTGVTGSATASAEKTLSSTPEVISGSPTGAFVSIEDLTRLQAEISGMADIPDASIAAVLTFGTITINNTSAPDQTYSITFDVSYGNSAAAAANAGEFAFATTIVSLDLETDGDVTDQGGLQSDPGVPGFYFNSGIFLDDLAVLNPEIISGGFSFTVDLDPGDRLDILGIADVFGSANAEAAPVPIGHAGPLALTALAGFGLLRLRRAA